MSACQAAVRGFRHVPVYPPHKCSAYEVLSATIISEALTGWATAGSICTVPLGESGYGYKWSIRTDMISGTPASCQACWAHIIQVCALSAFAFLGVERAGGRCV